MRLTNNFKFLPFFIGITLSGMCALTIHIFMQRNIPSLISSVMINKTILQPPYPLWLTCAAYVTAILPAIGMAIIYYLISPYLKIKSRLLRGTILGMVMLLAQGELIRQPLMNILVGNPVWVALLQQTQIWVPQLVMAIIIAFIIPSQS